MQTENIGSEEFSVLHCGEIYCTVNDKNVSGGFIQNLNQLSQSHDIVSYNLSSGNWGYSNQFYQWCLLKSKKSNQSMTRHQ